MSDPPQRADLAQPHAGVQAQKRRKIVRTGDRFLHQFLLLSGQNALFLRLCALDPDPSAGIFRDQTFFKRAPQRCGRQPIDALDRVVRQRGIFQRGHEIVNDPGRDRVELHFAQCGKDMLVCDADVGLVGGGLHAAQQFDFHPAEEPFGKAAADIFAIGRRFLRPLRLLQQQRPLHLRVLATVNIPEPGLAARRFSDHKSSLVSPILALVDVFAAPCHAVRPHSLDCRPPNRRRI